MSQFQAHAGLVSPGTHLAVSGTCRILVSTSQTGFGAQPTSSSVGSVGCHHGVKVAVP